MWSKTKNVSYSPDPATVHLIYTIYRKWLFATSQLSIKACPNTWLPKTLTSVQLQPNIAELCPAMVTYSPSNHSSQYKHRMLFMSLELSKFIQKLNIQGAPPFFPPPNFNIMLKSLSQAIHDQLLAMVTLQEKYMLPLCRQCWGIINPIKVSLDWLFFEDCQTKLNPWYLKVQGWQKLPKGPRLAKGT